MAKMIFDIDIQPFLNAFEKFEQFRSSLETEQKQAGAVQAYEYTFELAWKTMKRVLDKKGVVVNSPRDTFREAALNGLIADPEQWFVFLHKRNLTIHTYEIDNLKEVLSVFDDFSDAVKLLIQHLESVS